MLHYKPILKQRSRRLRRDMSDAEQRLWSGLRRKQILGVQFYRQRPIGDYIVDFYAPRARLVIEVDGGQHFDDPHMIYDEARDAFLKQLGLEVLRFDNLQVLNEVGAVLEVVFDMVERRKK